jgi:hypothetical protein
MITGSDIDVRWGLEEDENKVADLMQLNGLPRWAAFEDRFVVAECDGEFLAALAYRTAPKRLFVGDVVVDPWANERALTVALYAGARDLARELGAREIRLDAGGRRDCLLEAGYRRRPGGWRADARRRGAADLPAGGWRRVLALLGEPAVPFFRPFREHPPDDTGPSVDAGGRPNGGGRCA